MDDTGQFFKQVINFPNEKSLISLFNITLGLLAFSMIFLLIFLGYIVDFKQNQQKNQIDLVTATIITLQQDKTIKVDVSQKSPKIERIPAKIVTRKVKQLVVKELSMQDILYQKLLAEFQNDLLKWFAEIDRNSLTIRFQKFHFQAGLWTVDQSYQAILADFFPRYVEVLKTHKHAIEALSIEGHTSSEWYSSNSKDEAYFSNMALSQERISPKNKLST